MSTKPSNKSLKRAAAAAAAEAAEASPQPSKQKGPEKPQLSTAISDAILCVFTLYAVSALYREALGSMRQSARGFVVGQWQLLAAIALGLAGAAAGVGALRFAGLRAAKPLHELLAQAAMFLCMPCLGITAIFAYTGSSPQDTLPLSLLAALSAGWLAFELFPRALAKLKQDYILATSLFGVLCIGFRAVFVILGKSGSESPQATSAAWQGVWGTALVMVAGAVGVTGEIRGGPLRIKNVDLFHYVMAVANVTLVHMFQAMWQ